MYMRNICQQLPSNIQSLALLSLLFFSSSNCHALKEDLNKPVKIDASTVTFNKAKGFAIYQGNVSIVQGTLKFSANRIEIIAPNNVISKIEATGSPVTFEQTMDDGKFARGKAQKISYRVNEKRIILMGGATFSQHKDTFNSPYITYSTLTGELKAGSTQKAKKDSSKKSNRVQAIFYPTK